jgi:hypothetical protein
MLILLGLFSEPLSVREPPNPKRNQWLLEDPAVSTSHNSLIVNQILQVTENEGGENKRICNS